MADYDLDELRALKRRADTALAQATVAMAELQAVSAIMGSAINRLLDKSQTQGGSRDRIGDRMKEIERVIREAGGVAGGVWVQFAAITAALPDDKQSEIVRSLRSGRERLWEQDGDRYRLLSRNS